MDLASTATSARPKTKSLRATIPEGIVAYLGLESGDKLEWKMEGSVSKPFVTVRKTKE